MTVTVDLVQLTKIYKNATEPSVDAIDMSIDKGQLVAMLGPSGCGKTTTMKMVAGLLAPTSGDVQFDGRSVVDIPAEKRQVAMVFQKPLLFPHMDVEGNLLFALPRSLRGRQARRAAEHGHRVEAARPDEQTRVVEPVDEPEGDRAAVG